MDSQITTFSDIIIPISAGFILEKIWELKEMHILVLIFTTFMVIVYFLLMFLYFRTVNKEPIGFRYIIVLIIGILFPVLLTYRADTQFVVFGYSFPAIISFATAVLISHFVVKFEKVKFPTADFIQTTTYLFAATAFLIAVLIFFLERFAKSIFVAKDTLSPLYLVFSLIILFSVVFTYLVTWSRSAKQKRIASKKFTKK